MRVSMRPTAFGHRYVPPGATNGVRIGAVAVLVAFFMAACDGTSVTGPKVTTVTITPAGSVELTALGDTVRLEANPLDNAGQAISNVDIGWQSSDAAVITVDTLGLVTAVSEGTATISAMAGGVEGTKQITVAQRAATVVLVDGGRQSAEPGAALPNVISVRAEDAQGNVVPGAIVTFEVMRGGGSASTTQATADAQGLATTAWTLGSGAMDQELAAFSGSFSDTLEVPATVTSGRILWIDAPNTAAPGDTISVAVVAGLSDLAPAHWGVTMADLTWSGGPVAPTFFYSLSSDVAAAVTGGTTMSFAVTRPQNTVANDTILVFDFAVNTGASGEVVMELGITEIFSSADFQNLAGQVGTVGDIITIQP